MKNTRFCCNACSVEETKHSCYGCSKPIGGSEVRWATLAGKLVNGGHPWCAACVPQSHTMVLAGRFAVADVLSWGCETVNFYQLVDALYGGNLPEGAVVCEEYEHYDKDSLIQKLDELRSGYLAFADALQGDSK